MNLSTSLASIKGVGPKTAEQLHAAGLETVGDLITFLPRKHEDFSEVVEIDKINPGKRTIKARAESVEVKRVKRGMTVTTAVLADESGKLKAVWFNQPYRASQLKDVKTEYYFSGEFEFSYNRYQLTNPSVELVKDMPVQTDRILPIYRQIKGLKSQVLRKILAELRPLITMLPETLPPEIVISEKLVSYSDALLGMHFPSSVQDITKAKERLAYEELFQLLLASQLNREENIKLEGIAIPFDKRGVKQFVEKLPFALTNAQRLAAWEIIQDIEKPMPMNRLLQGDVGSGKTVVAGIAALSSARAGFQTALMAPTEILARQHAETLQDLLKPFDITVGLLIGSVKAKAREILYGQIEKGEVDIVVGTHALIQDTVKFHRLGLVVIDEQHRFGVAQRQKLLDKASKMPHLLAMTATPIPRSLQLTVFGELDVSILNERPTNRKPIKTKIVSPVSRQAAYGMIDQEIARGQQAYVICSLITDTEVSEKKSVETEYRKLKNSIFGHRSIGLLHGRMKSEEKEQVMNDFKAQKYDILVSTTVVEVGVDVPNASVIMIEDADHFGLAQLHQLRGRVGRGEHQSYCYLMMSDTKKPSQRLRELERSNDGFYLAQVDLDLRGPGEIYGRMQHGALNLQIASLADTKLLARAQKAAQRFVSSGIDLLQYKQLKTQVEKYQRLTTLN
ncbi:MAG TPA: ATP-dependent DNA helicase RecG [Candidatus Saccharimonadales bacterium]